MYGEGISKVGELLDIAVKLDIVQKAGAWFSYNGNRLGQGRDKVKELLKTDEALCKEIEELVWQNVDKLYERKPAAPKAKITEIPAAEKPAQKPAKSSAKIDVLVDE